MWKEYPYLPLSAGMAIGLAALILWSIIWKGIALWRAARNTHKGWFVVLLIVNTASILELIYIFIVDKKKSPPQQV